jgi:hypothetical protein
MEVLSADVRPSSGLLGVVVFMGLRLSLFLPMSLWIRMVQLIGLELTWESVVLFCSILCGSKFYQTEIICKVEVSYLCSQAPFVGWTSPYEVTLLVLSIIHFGAFSYWEMKMAKEPILPFNIWKASSLASSCSPYSSHS